MATFTREDRRDHRSAADNLSAYLDGELSAHDDARIKAHLARCESCRQDAATLRMTSQLLRQAPRQTLPRSFALSPSAVNEQKSYRRWSLAQTWLRTASAMVSVLLVLLLSGDVILSQGWLLPSSAPAAPQPMVSSEQLAAVPASETAAMAQLEAETIEMAPLMGAAEPELAAPSLQADSVGNPPVPEAQPMTAKSMAEPQAVAEPPTAEPVAGVSAAPAPLARAMPKSASAPPTGAGGGTLPPQVETGIMSEPSQAVAEDSAIMTAPTPQEFEQAPLAPDTQAPAVAAGKLGVATSESTGQEEAILMGAPEPTAAPSQPKEALSRGAAGSASEGSVSATSFGYARLWRAIRVASLLAVGLLMMLVAGLLVTWQKRRV